MSKSDIPPRRYRLHVTKPTKVRGFAKIFIIDGLDGDLTK